MPTAGAPECVCPPSPSESLRASSSTPRSSVQKRWARSGSSAGNSTKDREESATCRTLAVLCKQRERVASGGVRACTLDERCCAGRQDVGLWQGHAILGWHHNRRGQRREGQVGRAEALTAQVRTAVCEQPCHLVELAPYRCLVFAFAHRPYSGRAHQ